MSGSIVSDTGPLISLERLENGYLFIRQLYSKIIVPESVIQEIAQGFQITPKQYLEHHQITDLIEVKQPSKMVSIPHIDLLAPAETEAITLAKELHVELLIEERLGRQVAESANIKVSGILGQIIKAYRSQIINREEASKKLDELFQGGRINKKIYQASQAFIKEYQG